MAEFKGNAKVGAIIDAFMPGQAAAEATMQLLMGEVSSSGLLPITNYDKDFIHRRPVQIGNRPDFLMAISSSPKRTCPARSTRCTRPWPRLWTSRCASLRL